MYGIFSYIALYITWKPPHVQCRHKIFLNFGFALITYIPFPFSLLYNSSSFYQCLRFLWHLVMCKLLTKILLSLSKMQHPVLKWSILYVCFKYTGSTLLNYIWIILQVYMKLLEIYFNYTSSILQIYFNLLSYRRRSILQVYII